MEHHEKMLQRDRDITTLFRQTYKKPPQQTTTDIIVAYLFITTFLLATIAIPICSFIYLFRILSGG